MKNIFTTILIAILFNSCGSGDSQENSTYASADKQPVQYNISILLDLSDRLIQPLQPVQSERDIQIVSTIIDVFKNKMHKDGAYLSKSKLRILFNPAPTDPNVNNIAKKLSVDLSNIDNKKKKETYYNIEADFEEGLKDIYNLTLQSKIWIGSDIWRFFKYDVNELCIDKNSQYRNILIIVTDGYLYHEQSQDRQKNRTAFLTPKFLQRENLRISNWKDKFDEGDYGFITPEQSFENLEVMVLEINASEKFKNDEDIIRAYLGKWFDEMKIKNKVIYNTDLPANTQKRIENFFKE
jgi:hypothetical protein